MENGWLGILWIDVRSESIIFLLTERQFQLEWRKGKWTFLIRSADCRLLNNLCNCDLFVRRIGYWGIRELEENNVVELIGKFGCNRLNLRGNLLCGKIMRCSLIDQPTEKKIIFGFWFLKFKNYFDLFIEKKAKKLK
jgi:hypothetical protein